MKAKRTSKTTRARKTSNDLSLAGRGTSGKVKGGVDDATQDLRAIVAKVEDNRKMKESVRNL
jgi:hypothetical protein